MHKKILWSLCGIAIATGNQPDPDGWVNYNIFYTSMALELTAGDPSRLNTQLQLSTASPSKQLPTLTGVWVADPNATIMVTVDDKPLATFTNTNETNTWTYTPSHLAEGPHAFKATQSLMGISLNPSDPVHFIYDTIAPVLNVSGLPTTVQALSAYSGSVSAKDMTPVSFAATGLPAGLTLLADGTLKGTTPQTGSYSFTVTATDACGNTSTETVTLSVAPKVKTTGVSGSTDLGYTSTTTNASVASISSTGTVTSFDSQATGQILAQPAVGGTLTTTTTTGTTITSTKSRDGTVTATLSNASHTDTDAATAATTLITTASAQGTPVTLTSNQTANLTLENAIIHDLQTQGFNIILQDGSIESALRFSKGVLRIKGSPNTKALIVDPAVVWNMKNAKPTYTKLTFGTPTDTFNTLACSPQSTFTAKTFTLNNENILIIAYDPTDAGDLATGTKQIISANMNQKFDYVFKAAIDGDLLSLESLTPVEDGCAGASSIAMTVDQSDLTKGVTLTLTDKGQNVPSETSLDVALWTKIFETNTALASLFFSSSTTVTQSTLQTAQQANNLLAVIANVRSMLPNMLSTQGRQFHQTVARSMHSSPSTAGKLHNLCNALAKEGPVAFDSEQGRVWISPYVNVNTDDGSHGSGYGALMGGEYRNLDARYILAGYVGAGADKKDETVNHLHSTHITAGTYAAYNPWMDGRFDALYMITRNNVHNAMTDTDNQKGTYRNVVQTVDVMFSQVFRLDDTHTWSVRPSLGHTYIKSTTGAYTMTGDVINSRQKTSRLSATKSFSQEVYGGLGVRFDSKLKDVRMRITGVYEYGYEYRKSGKTPNITTSLYISKLTPGVANKKSRTHYISANASFLAQNDWKFIVSYNGAYSGSSKNHMIAAKFERRF